MTPVLVQVTDREGAFLLIGFSTLRDHPLGILVRPGGALDWAFVENITIERPNTDYPIGLGPWSRVDAERVPA